MLSLARRANPSLPTVLCPQSVSMFWPSDQIGPYTLTCELGSGTFGVVWLAERRAAITTTKVALKHLAGARGAGDDPA